MKKAEPATKKEDTTIKNKPEAAKEEGTTTQTKHIRVVYSDKRKKTIIYSVSAIILLIICVCAFAYVSIQPQTPRFVLEDLYVDPLSSNSSLMVKLTSTNPSPKSSVYYSKIGLYVSIQGDFYTDPVFLDSTLQQPRGVVTWTAVLASNNSESSVMSGTFQLRSGVTYGDVIADLSIQWKSGFFTSSKFDVRVICPVLLKLEDLSSAISKPMSKCSHHFT